MIEAARRTWDPVMADQIAAHVTLVYPQEAPLVDLLVERLRAACATTSPFRLRLGGLACFERPEDGVYVAVEDVDGGYAALRAEVLRPPFQPAAFPPHVTLVHPRTSAHGRELWEHHRDARYDSVFRVTETALTAFDGMRWITRATFALRGPA